MITLAAFYKDLQLDKESILLNDAVKKFNYKKSLLCLKETFEKNNFDGKFLATTDLETALPLSDFNIFRSQLKEKKLIESLVLSNTEIIKATVGKIILCGSDHLINGNLNNLFIEDFDIGILFNGTSVNNSVVLANITQENRNRIIDFFETREKEFYNLTQINKDWYGDQISYEIVLRKQNLLNTDKIISGIYQGITCKFKFMIYGENVISGCSKKNPNFNKKSLFIDFKGERKQWFNHVYNEIK